MARKVYKGAKNNKARTVQKLVQAVGAVIQTKGYPGLTATNISKAAGLSRRLISTYFGSVDNLVETYVRTKDYWVEAAGSTKITEENKAGKKTRQLLESLLINQFNFFNQNEEMQKIILWQISQRTEIMLHICNERETLSKAFFTVSDKELKGRNVDLRAIAGLLVAGIYYMILHAKATDSLFCEIDVNDPKGKKRIMDAVKLILKWAYQAPV